MKAATKLITASTLALTLVVCTSCRVENIVPELEPYLSEVTGSDSQSFMSALSAASSGGSSTSDFKEGFKSGYAAGYAEAAKRIMGSTPNAAPAVTQVAIQSPAPVSAPAYPGAPAITPVTATASNASTGAIPSWGYSTGEYAAKVATKPVVKTSSSSSYKKSSSSSRYSRSRRGCAGGS